MSKVELKERALAWFDAMLKERCVACPVVDPARALVIDQTVMYNHDELTMSYSAKRSDMAEDMETFYSAFIMYRNRPVVTMTYDVVSPA
jgi:hypothetical protein